MDCGSKSGEWGTRRRNCRRGREWCFLDGGPRGSAGRRTRELTASTSPSVGRWEEGKRGYWVDEAALAAGAAARGPGAVGSLGGGEGDAWQAGRWAPVKGLVVEQRQQLQEQPPQQPPRPLPQVPRENGCGAGRAAKFASARRGADWLGKPAPNSAVRPPGWSPWQDPRGWWLVPLLAVQKVEAGAGRRRRLPLCSSPPLPHPVRATSPPPLRPPLLPALSPSRVCPPSRASRLKATAPAPLGEEALLLPDMVQSGGRRAMAPWHSAAATAGPGRAEGAERRRRGAGRSRGIRGAAERRLGGRACEEPGEAQTALCPSPEQPVQGHWVEHSGSKWLARRGRGGPLANSAVEPAALWRRWGSRRSLGSCVLAALGGDLIPSLVRVLPLPAGVCLLSLPGSLPSVDWFCACLSPPLGYSDGEDSSLSWNPRDRQWKWR